MKNVLNPPIPRNQNFLTVYLKLVPGLLIKKSRSTLLLAQGNNFRR